MCSGGEHTDGERLVEDGEDSGNGGEGENGRFRHNSFLVFVRSSGVLTFLNMTAATFLTAGGACALVRQDIRAGTIEGSFLSFLSSSSPARIASVLGEVICARSAGTALDKSIYF